MVGALAALSFPTQPLAEPATDLEPFDLQVNREHQGDIVATIEDATAGENAEVVCKKTCQARYRPGRIVTLTARPAGSFEFGFWSDDRCPPGPVCRLKVDRGNQTVVATFSPQLVVVAVTHKTTDLARLTSEPPSEPPVPAPAPYSSCGAVEIAPSPLPQVWCREFPASKEKEVKLNAEGLKPYWGMGAFGDACDAIDGASCSLMVHSRRVVALNFDGPSLPRVGEPGEVLVVFRIAMGGTGSGTVRSKSLDCGDKCKATLNFGDRLTLEADAKNGSRFVGWRGACAASPRCTLAVGPVTRITAVFDAVAQSPETKPSGTRPSGTRPSKRMPSQTKPQQSKRGSSSKALFVARVGRIVVRDARRRRVLFTVGVNARSSIRAVLKNARGRPVSARTWAVQRGKRVLWLRVPRQARRGTYVLRITARNGAGNVKRFKRHVRLRR